MNDLAFIKNAFVISLATGVIFTIIIGIYYKKQKEKPSKKYKSGLIFSIFIFALLLMMGISTE